MDQIRLTKEEIDALLKRVKANNIQTGDYEIIQSMADAIMTLGKALDDKATSIKRLLAMLFGPKTEKKDDVLKDNEPGEQKEKPAKSKPEEKKKGHGNRSSSDYTGAKRNSISHETLKPKDLCPKCPNGKLYPIKEPGIAIYLKGQPPH